MLPCPCDRSTFVDAEIFVREAHRAKWRFADHMMKTRRAPGEETLSVSEKEVEGATVGKIFAGFGHDAPELGALTLRFGIRTTTASDAFHQDAKRASAIGRT